MKLVDRLAEHMAPGGSRGESIAEASRIGEISGASKLLLAIAVSFAALIAWAALAKIDLWPRPAATSRPASIKRCCRRRLPCARPAAANDERQMLEKLVAQGLDRTDFIKLAHGSRS